MIDQAVALQASEVSKRFGMLRRYAARASALTAVRSWRCSATTEPASPTSSGACSGSTPRTAATSGWR
jgi:hypothetical protein